MKDVNIFLLFMFLSIALFNNSVFATLDDGLIAYYPFNGNASDESGNSNDGIVHGATLYNDINKEVYSFDGDDYIDLGNDITLQLTNNFTIMLWTKINTEQNGSFVSKTYGYPEQSKRAIEFYISDSAKSIVAYFWNSSSQYFKGHTRSINHLMNQWIHIVLQHDNALTEHQMRIFINGEEEVLTFNYESVASIPEIRNTTETMKIGCFRPTDGEPSVTSHFKGLMDEVRIYNKVLSHSDILQIYQESYRTFNDSDTDGVINQWDECPDTSEGSAVFSNGCKTNAIYTQEEYDSLTQTVNSLNFELTQKIQQIATLQNKVNSMYTQEQVDDLLAQKEDIITQLNKQIKSMYTQEQLDQASANAVKGLYTDEHVNMIINKILEWDTNNDGTIGLVEAIQALKISTNIKPIE